MPAICRYSSQAASRPDTSWPYTRSSSSTLPASAAATFSWKILGSSRSWTRMPTRDALSAYAGPMPRLVVPICLLPSQISCIRSSRMWYGMIRCALPEMRRPAVETPLRSRSSISVRSAFGSMTTPLPMTASVPGLQMPAGTRWRANLPSVVLDGVAGVVAALVADDQIGLLAEEVDDLAFAFVAPLGADDHGRGHGNLQEIARTATCDWPREVYTKSTADAGGVRHDGAHRSERPTAPLHAAPPAPPPAPTPTPAPVPASPRPRRPRRTGPATLVCSPPSSSSREE